jgi:ubiquinone/menaquinone biosynthesis C-methylase UbiE
MIPSTLIRLPSFIISHCRFFECMLESRPRQMIQPETRYSAPLDVETKRHLDFLRAVLKKLALPERPRVLQFGCGVGDATRLLAEHLEGYGQIVALDPNSKAIRAARARTDPAQYPHIQFRTVQAGHLPFHAAEFDFILCARALMYVDHPQEILRELARVLRVGGQLLAVELDFEGYLIVDAADPSRPSLPGLNPYIARALLTLLREAGLEPTDILPNFIVSPELLTRDALLNKAPGVRTLRPRLRHLERLDLNDYIRETESAVKAQTQGHSCTLLELAMLAHKS